MRDTPRRRRTIGRAWLWCITPLFRHSYWRDAYILRGVGEFVGPVFERKRKSVAPRPAPTQPAPAAERRISRPDAPAARQDRSDDRTAREPLTRVSYTHHAPDFTWQAPPSARGDRPPRRSVDPVPPLPPRPWARHETPDHPSGQSHEPSSIDRSSE